MAKILIVEDDSSLRVVIRMLLEQDGYEVDEAPNGRVALEGLAGTAPDLVLVDSKMPFLDGPALIERLRAEPRFASIPAVLMTGFSPGAEDKHRADVVIVKPFEKSQLIGVVRRLLAERELRSG